MFTTLSPDTLLNMDNDSGIKDFFQLASLTPGLVKKGKNTGDGT